MNNEIYTKLKEIIISSSEAEIDIDLLSPTIPLMDIGINSISFIKILVEIESEFDFEFDDEDLDFDNDNNIDLGTFIGYLETKINEGAAVL